MMATRSIADPRPRIVEVGGSHLLDGGRCREGHALLRTFARCPRCGAAVDEARFGPLGRVWSYTSVHIGSRPDETVPYTLAYVDLVDGPRVLLRLPGNPAGVGANIRLVSTDEDGNPRGEEAD